MHKLVGAVLMALIPIAALAGEIPSPDGRSGPPLDLTQSIAAAQEANPRVRSLLRAYEGLLERPEQSRALPDPMVSYGFMVEDTVTANGPITGVLELSQEIPFARKRPLRADVSRKEAEAARHAWESARLDVALEVRSAYYELFRVDRTIEIVEEEGSVLDRLEEVARQRYATGLARQGDVLRAQTERSMIEERLLELRAERESAAAAFNAALGREATAPVGSALDPPVAPELPHEREIYETSRSARPEIAMAQRQAEAGTIRESLVRRDFYPDFRVGVQWNQIGESENPLAPDSGQDAYMITVGVSLPIWRGSLRAGIRETAALTEAAQQEVRDRTIRAEAEVRASLAAVRAQEDLAALYARTVIPQADASLESSRASYEAGGEVGFLDVLDSERRLLAARIGHVSSLAGLGKALAALERAIGSDLASVSRSRSAAPAAGGAS